MSESNVKMMSSLVKSCWWVNNCFPTLGPIIDHLVNCWVGVLSREGCADTNAAITQARVVSRDMRYMGTRRRQ